MGAIPTATETILAYMRGPEHKKDAVFIRDKEYAAKDLSADDLEILIEELDTMVDREANPVIAAIIARGAPRVLDAVRMVNSSSKAGYKGAVARGPELVANPLDVDDMSSAQNGATAKTTWLATITSVGGAGYAGTATYDIQMLVSSLPNLAHVILGFVDPVEVPKVSMVQLIKNSDAWSREYVTLNWRDTFGNNATPVYELKQPWMVPPGEEYYIAANYYITGDDKLQPIGFAVKRATDILTALA